MLQLSDEVLVQQCRLGDREAFSEIVRRYQNLICSVAYCSTGNIAASEELAQEVFLTAWSSLKDLRDPKRLRSWLCGIAKNLSADRFRKRKRDVLDQASQIDHSVPADHFAQDPAQESLAREEAELVDRTMHSLPEQYRAPMVLFYREQQSVGRVAELLDLTPDAVKQRLARGRKMLRQEVTQIVERGLEQSAPGRAFTAGVVAALPVMSGGAKAATVALTSVKGVHSMSLASAGGLLGAVLGPFAGIAGAYFGYTMSMKSAESERERAFLKKSTLVFASLAIGLGSVIGSIVVFRDQIAGANHGYLATAIVTTSIVYMVSLFGLITWTNRRVSTIRREEGSSSHPEKKHAMQSSFVRAPQVFSSRARLLGVPLISVAFHGSGGPDNESDERNRKTKSGAAVGWIAIGEKAYGILFASGAFAVGTIAVGAVSIGPIAIGGLGIGLLSIAGFSFAIWALGGFAIGWHSFGGIAIAYKAAAGGLAIARSYALGGYVSAEQANNDAVKSYFAEDWFFGLSQFAVQPWGWLIMLGLAFLPAFLALKFVPRAEQNDDDSSPGGVPSDA